MRVTLKDIAKKANVNFTLVSKYINKTPGVSIRAETRQRIEDAIRELNYRPIAAARALRSGKSNTLGLAVYNLTNEYFAHYADAAIREAEKHGYNLLISVSRDNSLGSAVASLDSNQVDGIICCDNFNSPQLTCPIISEQAYSADSMKESMRQAVNYLKRKHCRNMTGIYFGSPLWAEMFDSVNTPAFPVESYDFPVPMDQRADRLRKICRERPDAVFLAGWITVNLFSSILDREFPDYDPVILTWANCKGPFMKNPRIKGVILTSTLLLIKELITALTMQIRQSGDVVYPHCIPSRFISREDSDFITLEADTFSLT